MEVKTWKKSKSRVSSTRSGASRQSNRMCCRSFSQVHRQQSGTVTLCFTRLETSNAQRWLDGLQFIATRARRSICQMMAACTRHRIRIPVARSFHRNRMFRLWKSCRQRKNERSVRHVRPLSIPESMSSCRTDPRSILV